MDDDGLLQVRFENHALTYLPMSQRTYSYDVCGLVTSRDKNPAAVMVVRAGFNPAGVDDIRPWVSAGYSGCLSQESRDLSVGLATATLQLSTLKRSLL